MTRKVLLSRNTCSNLRIQENSGQVKVLHCTMIISAKYRNQFYNSKNRGNHTAGFSVTGQKNTGGGMLLHQPSRYHFLLVRKNE